MIATHPPLLMAHSSRNTREKSIKVRKAAKQKGKKAAKGKPARGTRKKTTIQLALGAKEMNAKEIERERETKRNKQQQKKLEREAIVSLAQAFIDGTAKAKAYKASKTVADTGEGKEAQFNPKDAIDVDKASSASTHQTSNV